MFSSGSKTLVRQKNAQFIVYFLPICLQFSAFHQGFFRFAVGKQPVDIFRGHNQCIR